MRKDKDSVIKWARQMIQQDFVVLDTETTGLNDDDVCVQIGIVDKAGRVLLDTLVKPYKSIPRDATKIHGITNFDVREAPTILELEPQIETLLKGKTVLVYNVDFDTRMIRQSFKYSGRELPGFLDFKTDEERHAHWFCGCLWIDVMSQYAMFYGEWSEWHGAYRWQKLTTAAAHLGISANGAHGAAADARITLGVVQAMADRLLWEETGNDD